MPNTLSSASNPVIHNRHSIRLPGYDYTQPGAYDLTILTHKREHLFGEVVGGVVKLSPVGEVVQKEWLKIPPHFSNVLLDAYVIMPDHMHGILVITVGEVHTPGQRTRIDPSDRPELQIHHIPQDQQTAQDSRDNHLASQLLRACDQRRGGLQADRSLYSTESAKMGSRWGWVGFKLKVKSQKGKFVEFRLPTP